MKEKASPVLVLWATENKNNGVERAALHGTALNQGWSEEVIVASLDEVFGCGELTIPELVASNKTTITTSDGTKIRVEFTMTHPRVVLLSGVLSAEECAWLIEDCKPRMTRSQTISNQGGVEVNAARTSNGTYYARGQNTLVAKIEQRLSELFNWPISRGEGLQVLQYGVGAEYKPHYDYFDPGYPGCAQQLVHGGQRVGTIVLYLNDVEEGGSTVFPDVGLNIMPVKGSAVFFSYDRPVPQTKTLHGGSPVISGEKWIATKWLRERDF